MCVVKLAKALTSPNGRSWAGKEDRKNKREKKGRGHFIKTANFLN